MQARIALLEQALAEKQARGNRITFKVSTKGAVQINGLRRFPVTLYRGEWDRVFAQMDELKQFIAANADRLAVKGDED